jgi:choline-glycine betaine transporter
MILKKLFTTWWLVLSVLSPFLILILVGLFSGIKAQGILLLLGATGVIIVFSVYVYVKFKSHIRYQAYAVRRHREEQRQRKQAQDYYRQKEINTLIKHIEKEE